METQTYVHMTKPLEFKKFNLYNSPTGWIRIDILKSKLKTDSEFKNKFSDEELKTIGGFD